MKKILSLLFLIVFLSGCSLYNKNVSDNNSELIIGRWIAIDDSESVIEFSDTTKTDYYSGEKMLEGKYVFKENTNGIIVDYANNETFEYAIIELDEDSLTLMYLPRGNFLRYEKEY